MLKKGNWQERERERESVTDGCHDRPGKPGKRGDKKLGQNSSIRQFSDARQLGCVFQDMTPPLRKSTDMPKPIQRVKFTKAIARHTKIRDRNPSHKEVDLGEPTSFLEHVYLGCTQRQCEISKDIVDNYRTMFESRISAGGVEKLPYPQNLRMSSWSNDMAGHAKKCVER